MSFYAQMQDIARELLTEFDQGGMVLISESPGSGPAHNPGPPVRTLHRIAGTASGVTAEHLKDTLIQASDLRVILPGHITPKPTDKVMINGHVHNIVKIIPKPAAGVPSVFELVVRK